jgi:hypothetical protein
LTVEKLAVLMASMLVEQKVQPKVVLKDFCLVVLKVASSVSSQVEVKDVELVELTEDLSDSLKERLAAEKLALLMVERMDLRLESCKAEW